MNENLLLAFGLTLVAGLSTGIGSALALFAKRTNTRFLAFSMGLSAGVMIYVSFTEILGEAEHSLSERFGEVAGPFWTVVAFFAGIGVIALIDHILPEPKNPHHAGRVEDLAPDQRPDKLLRMGMFTALAIAIHNFPEGVATFTSALADPALGISIAVAIAIHNIPEGIAVSVPVYYATGSRKKAFWLSFASGLSEPVGAVVGYVLLRNFMGPAMMGSLLAGVAGVMVFISLDELLPAAHEYDEGHVAIYGVVAGMAVMAISLLLLG
jgi:zinc transporter, ZIP family